MPPCKLLQSPMADTEMSMRVPGCANGGRLVVTSTAAVFLTRMAVGETATPMRARRFVKLCDENTVCLLSPVPFKPTTRPYPTNWLSRTPSIDTRSFKRVQEGAALSAAISKRQIGKRKVMALDGKQSK